MGRPPSCSCNCSPVGTDCEFTDDFSTTKPGYTAYEIGGAGLPTFSVSGGKLICGTSTAGTYARSVTIPAAGLRTVGVQANVYYGPPSTDSSSGLFIGNARFFFASWSTVGAMFGEPCNAIGHTTGFPTFSAGTPASGDLLRLQIQETAPGIFDIAYFQNGSEIHTETGVALTITSPVNVGVWVDPEFSGTPAWDNLEIDCTDTGACPLYDSVPVVWAVPGIPGIGASGGSPSCASCAIYRVDIPLFFAGGSGSFCTWASADQIVCGGTKRDAWFMSMSASTIILQAAFNEVIESEFAAQYQGPITNPLGPNTLALFGTPSGCITFPPLITIAPG